MTLKQKLINRELTIGSWLSFSYPPICEMMAKAGFEWLVVDMEHTAIDVGDAHHLIQIIDLSGCVPLVRVGSNEPLAIKRAMDAGAHGVVVPMINTPQDAQMAVDALYYPPRGTRGVGLARAQKYGIGFDAYRKWAEHETILIVQIEHIDGVNNIDEIISVEGVDGFLVGPYDLSASLGRPGDWQHRSVVDALEKVESVISQGATVGGYHVVHKNDDELRRRIAGGYKFIAYGSDMVFFAEKLQDEVNFLNQNLVLEKE